jgi:hypothetical protein
MDLCEVTIKYGGLVVFIRHDSAETWGLGMDSHLLLVLQNYDQGRCFRSFPLKRSISNFPCSPNIMSPTHKRSEGRAPLWFSEFTSKDAALQGGR